MEKSSNEDIIKYRLVKSEQTLKEAYDNVKLGNWSLVANRLYYATYYLVLAVNMKNGDYSKTHTGTFSIFSKNYIATGILSREEGNLYRNLFSMRQSGDYDDFFDWTEKDIKPVLPEVEKLLVKIKKLISA